jgi:hypothetical protein
MNMRVQFGRRNFRTSEFHAVASGRFGLVKRHVSLVKKVFRRPAAPLLIQQEPEAHRYRNETAG